MASPQQLSFRQKRLTQLREVAADAGNYLLPVTQAEEWYCFVWADEGKNDGSQANILLAKAYGSAPVSRNSKGKTWAAVPEAWQGYIFPPNELERLPLGAIEKAITALGVRKEEFRWDALLTKVLAADAVRGGSVPRVVSVLWHYVLQYADMLNRAHRAGRGVGLLLQRLPGATDFANRLPLEQGLDLLLLLSQRAYAKHWSPETFNRLLGLASPEVRDYITTHRETLQRGLELGRSTNAKLAESDFYGLYEPSLRCALVQELIDDSSGEGLIGEYSVYGRPDATEDLRLGGRIKRFADKVARQQALLFKPAAAPAAAPLFRADPVSFTEGQPHRWYELPEAEREQLLADYAAEGRDVFPAVVTSRHEQHLLRLANALTTPVIRWEDGESGCYPQWHLPGAIIARSARVTYANEVERARTELNELEKQLVKLRSVTTLGEVTRFGEALAYFQNPVVRARLREALQQQRRRINAKQDYREQRAREFGIDLADESAYRKSLWLEEMLTIEEEVRPYLSYVRRAFASALPGGTTVEFDPYRHSHDGVEFDPETVQDPEKWLRGDVMKTLRGRKHYTPIVQVNTFCLDYSRSMTHDLMRDLFKVVFALVLGLEGRQSYDAVHFFSSDFFEVVGYDNSQQYTSRRILFRILRQVAEIYGGRIIYSGEGGTNISAGVAESHARMQAFTKQLREEQPELNFVSSLFVLTDGQPTMGITNLEHLNYFIAEKRREGDIEINGIYLKHPDDKADFISQIFGAEHSVEASAFADTVRTFVELMGRTYRTQRRDFRAQQKRRKLLGLDAAGNPVSPYQNKPS